MGIYVSNKLYRRGRSEQPKADKKKANSPTYNYASKHNVEQETYHKIILS